MDELLTKCKYKILRELNHGAFGTVYKAIKVDTNEVMAVKMIDLSKMELSFRQKYLVAELGTLLHCKHPNIIATYDIQRCKDLLFVFMEFASNGTLTEFVKKNGRLSEPQTRFWFGQMVQAMMYLHREHRMAHRDIKLDNMLLTETNQAKLTDFGFAKCCWDNRRHCAIGCRTVCGTLPYMCPQLLANQPYNAFLYDSWAMGISLYAMLYALFPFHAQDAKLMLHEQTLCYPNYLLSRFGPWTSGAAVDLIVRMLDPSEATRFTIHECSKHVWLNMGWEE